MALLLFAGSMIIGMTGFMVVEGFNVNEAFYMTAITFSTVGFQEVHPLSAGGRIFTGIYIILNLGIFAYVISVFSTFLVEGELKKAFRNFIIGRDVKKMKDHVIICGFGRNGIKAAEVLFREGKDFVVIEREQDVVNSQAANEKYQFVRGDATQDETLSDAGIDRAHTIITALPKDADNVFITLTASQINPGIKIIARASEAPSEKKLYRAGATHVVMPDTLGGAHMAQLITKPYVIEFLDVLNGLGDGDLHLDEFSCNDLKSEIRGMSLKEMDIRGKTGASVIAVKKADKTFVFNPGPSMVISDGDIAILLGKLEDISAFKKMFLD